MVRSRSLPRLPRAESRGVPQGGIEGRSGALRQGQGRLGRAGRDAVLAQALARRAYSAEVALGYDSCYVASFRPS